MGKILIIKNADFSAVKLSQVKLIRNKITITVLANPTVGGTVSGNGIYNEGTIVSICAIANTGYIFNKWSDGNTNINRNITADVSTTYIANFKSSKVIFEQIQYNKYIYTNDSHIGSPVVFKDISQNSNVYRGEVAENTKYNISGHFFGASATIILCCLVDENMNMVKSLKTGYSWTESGIDYSEIIDTTNYPTAKYMLLSNIISDTAISVTVVE